MAFSFSNATFYFCALTSFLATFYFSDKIIATWIFLVIHAPTPCSGLHIFIFFVPPSLWYHHFTKMYTCVGCKRSFAVETALTRHYSAYAECRASRRSFYASASGEESNLSGANFSTTSSLSSAHSSRNLSGSYDYDHYSSSGISASPHPLDLTLTSQYYGDETMEGTHSPNANPQVSQSANCSRGSSTKDVTDNAMDLTLLDATMEGTVPSNPDPQLSQCTNRSKASSTKDVTNNVHNKATMNMIRILTTPEICSLLMMIMTTFMMDKT